MQLIKWSFNALIIPIFQVNTKFLAPLFLAYDDRLKEKEQLIRTYDVSNLQPDREKACVAKTQHSFKEAREKRGRDWTQLGARAASITP